MDEVEITIWDECFRARFQPEEAPETCRYFERLLPWMQRLIHSRWSGEACWIPLGELAVQAPLENPTQKPEAGQILFHPGGRSEAEVLLVYGTSRFACKDGDLCGTPFLRIYDRLDVLAEIGGRVLWEGAAPIRFSSPADPRQPQVSGVAA